MTETLLRELSSRYIQKTSHVLKELKFAERPLSIDKPQVEVITEEAKRYARDAKYYLDGNRLETSLASIAYCEGLLDALRMLGLVKFSW